jgi:hypothetical protein
MLRRRTGEILSTLLLASLLASLVGTAYVVWHAPGVALRITIVAIVLACALCAALDEFGWLAVALSIVFAIFGNGLYALHLLAFDIEVIALVGTLLAALVVLILGRALLASGSADYPYDE